MIASRAVHLMRHGATALNGHLVGHEDVPVTAEGIAACLAAADTLAFTRVVSSDLSRAADCAAAIGATFRRDARWRELDFGAWDGCDPATLDAAALADFWRDPDAAPPPGGERWSALVARVGAALHDLDDGTLVVTHGGAIRAALAGACGFDVRQAWAFALPCASVVSLRLWEDAAQIVALRP